MIKSCNCPECNAEKDLTDKLELDHYLVASGLFGCSECGGVMDLNRINSNGVAGWCTVEQVVEYYLRRNFERLEVKGKEKFVKSLDGYSMIEEVAGHVLANQTVQHRNVTVQELLKAIRNKNEEMALIFQKELSEKEQNN